MNLRRYSRWLVVAPLALGLGIAARGRTAGAADVDVAEKNERCATRVSIALLGRGASPDLLASSNPQGSVDAFVGDPRFVERLARYLNASFNTRPGETASEDAVYYLARHVLERGMPYKQLFLGAFNVDADAGGNVVVKEDPEGLGYFRSLPWLRRYAGNESTGLKIVTAYRIMNNTVGLKLMATTNAPEADVSATGRAAGACRGCHFDSWSALDSAAKVLTRREGAGATMKFLPPPPSEASQKIADRVVTNDKEMVNALVNSEAFEFNVCRTAFQFLYGREENACEAETFDACMTTFKAKGTIQSAIATVAKDPGFCQ